MTDGVGRVRDLETKVRDCINRPRLHHALYTNDLKAFNVICSALDVIGDTTMAIDAYARLEESGDYGVRYLRLYGLLQALFIQQDAAEHILESLDIGCDVPREELLYVREVRNKAIGHPTKRERRPKQKIPQSSHAIARNSLRLDSFMLMSFMEDGEVQNTFVQVADLVAQQEIGIAQILLSALKRLREREEEHRMKFKNQSLAEIFPSTIDYYFQKLYAGCRGGESSEFTMIHVDLLCEILASFRAALAERGIIPAYAHVLHELDDAAYPLGEVKKYIAGDSSSTLNAKSGRIFVFFLEHQFRALLDLAQAFDKEYLDEASQ
jgi:hypothetical protein